MNRIPKARALLPLVLSTLTALVLPGCHDGENAKVAEVAEAAAERQAGQNRELARLNREVAEGTKRLVESEGRARAELVALQRSLQAEQATIGHQRDRLDDERRELAEDRRRESVVAAALLCLGELALCALPLVLCWCLLHGLGQEPEAELVERLLVEELDRQPPRLPSYHDPPPALPQPDEDESG